MSKIDDYELNIRRQLLASEYQRYQANVGGMNSGNFDKSHIASPIVTGRIAGRLVIQINSCDSKEARSYQNYLHSTVEDQLRNDCVNTIKKTEPHLYK